ncbi:predicted protein [Botrytis cinerea T4]|uniref:Uncharacterized protein n=1 Tax=Botryotinia fuckeliana (strain T4) TaxID=999810 RepID=G2XTV3_BOTF4|nr:predicted protein [Botrytis cinerea T4]
MSRMVSHTMLKFLEAGRPHLSWQFASWHCSGGRHLLVIGRLILYHPATLSSKILMHRESVDYL